MALEVCVKAASDTPDVLGDCRSVKGLRLLWRKSKYHTRRTSSISATNPNGFWNKPRREGVSGEV